MKRMLLIIPFILIAVISCDVASEVIDQSEDQWTIGHVVRVQADEIDFNMIYANDRDSVTFPVSTNYTTPNDSGTAVLTQRFFMAESELTYQQWIAVKAWAETDRGDGKRSDGGPLYYFANAGREGYDGVNGAALTPGSLQPVVYVSYRDAIAWCNAVTEYYNANNGSKPDLDCVYYTDAVYTVPLRDAVDEGYLSAVNPNHGGIDNPYIKAVATGNISMENCIARGFRLPTGIEWEYAARYRGSDSVNTVAGYSNPYFTKGNSLSGATTFYNDATGVAPNYAGRLANDLVAVYNGYWNGSAWVSYNLTDSSDVKSKLPNALGIYDMSGNVHEMCFGWHPDYAGSQTVVRGGWTQQNSQLLQIGYLFSQLPFIATQIRGFRLAKSR